jgi:hypothetical protein
VALRSGLDPSVSDAPTVIAPYYRSSLLKV